MATTDVRFVVTFDDKGNIKKVQDFDKALADLGKTAATASGKTSSFSSDFMKNLIPAMTAATLAADAVKKSFQFVKQQLEDSIVAAMEAEKVDRALESTLSIIGETAGGTADSIRNLAATMQKQTVYDDEAVKSAATLAIQMRGTADGIETLTKGAAGLASVFGMDLSSAARAVAQGMEGNYRALGMLIPAIRNAKTEGDKYLAMMDFLKDAYKRSEDESKTFDGKLKDLKKSYEELQETIGGFITKNQKVLDTLGGIKVLIDGINGVIGKKNPFDLLGNAAIALPLPVKIAMAGLEKMGQGVREMQDRDIKPLDDGLYDLSLQLIAAHKSAQPLVAQTLTLFPARLKMTREEMIALRNSISGFVEVIDLETPKVVQSLGELVGGGVGKLIDFREAAEDFGLGVAGNNKKVEDSTTGMADVWDTALQSMTARLVTFGDANASVWQNIGAVFGNFVEQAIAGMEAMYIRQILISKGIVKAKQGEATASHIANIFKTVPFPLDLILAAGAFAVVNALFSKILKFEKGGYFTQATMLPPHIVGEAGPEYYLPEKKLVSLIKDAASSARGGAAALAGPSGSLSFVINGPVISTTAALTDDVIRESASRLFSAIENQARLRGRRLLNG